MQEELALGKPVLAMRTNTERPEAVNACGAARLVGVNQNTIYEGARELMTSKSLYQSMSQAINPFGDGHAATKIVEVIEQFLEAHV